MYNQFKDCLQNNIMNENEIISKFIDITKKFYSDVDVDFNHFLENINNSNNLLRCIYDKYPHLKRTQRLTKRTKRIEGKALVNEILEREEYNNIFTRDEKKIVYMYCVKKIKGIYKHAQALKTGYGKG